MVLAVTANLARKRAAADAWAGRVLDDIDDLPDIVFAQEVPAGWTDLWPRELGYRVFSTPTRGWTVRSAVITRLPVVEDAVGLVSAAYHGSYLQTAVVDWGDDLGPVRLVSFHASPNLCSCRRFLMAN